MNVAILRICMTRRGGQNAHCFLPKARHVVSKMICQHYRTIYGTNGTLYAGFVFFEVVCGDCRCRLVNIKYTL